MKKFLTVLLTLSILMSMTACGGTASTSSQSADPTQNAAAAATQKDTPEEAQETVQQTDQAATEEAVQQAAVADTQDSAVESSAESAADTSSSAATEADAADEFETIETVETINIREPGSSKYDDPVFDFSIEALEEVPAENEDVSIENVEFFTAEDGSNAMRVFFRFKNNSDEVISFDTDHSWYAIQDENLLDLFYGPIPQEEDNTSLHVEPGKDVACACSFTLKTDSPAAFVVTVLNDDLTEDIPVAARIIEIEE